MSVTAIDMLAHRPEAIPELAVAFKAQWSPDRPPEHVESIKQHFRKCMNTDRFPMALVAYSGESVSGVVALLERSVKSRSDLRPWLGALYVFPKFRCQGIGAMLIRTAEQAARRLGVEALYAGTETATGLFRRAGWDAIQQVEEDGEHLTVFRKQIVA
jgi:GNAT superfamily N-acetyltransferase